VASEKQVAANRLNAKRSTGPRTEAGKRSARGNARTHGFSSKNPYGLDATEIARLSQELAAAEGCEELGAAEEFVRTAAALKRVAIAGAAAFGKLVAALLPSDVVRSSVSPHVTRDVDQLLRLGRYEQRLLSRQDRAIRRMRASTLSHDG
jgi:hypothetical protein